MAEFGRRVRSLPAHVLTMEAGADWASNPALPYIDVDALMMDLASELHAAIASLPDQGKAFPLGVQVAAEIASRITSGKVPDCARCRSKPSSHPSPSTVGVPLPTPSLGNPMGLAPGTSLKGFLSAILRG